MQWISNRLRRHLPDSHEWRYYGTLGGLALMAPVTLGAMLWLLPAAQGQVADNWYTDGANGVLQVRGALTESACRLEMASAWQDISLGEIGTGRLQNVGDRGAPVAFELLLRDCLRSPAGSRDSRSGALVWADNQPAVSVSFRAVQDADNPQLVKAQGIAGLGLRLEDARGQDVRLGSRGEPMLLTPGQNTLSYTVAPERTAANLVAGSYRATLDFSLSYD
ncbi:PAP fimbrial minor pilin protein precursor [Serratia marcescens]|uniref:fimbrial protein n=1 Tax=Serratia marcescens TaxID=615 RepID=UPI000E1C763E|nr:fimbrial protein [Serratia marcescens]AXK22115.1 Fimbrial family protein [Serratia marcescens]MBH2526193.1 type 1 fimbrial protein [Serratia marcescens]MBH2888063.1 type 1 fimbrial protein [Serratia marcescens]MBH2998645.1 type 1 fimbrial protein [Serratia marcescens]MBH3137829.1 type 1 fimbrial protein [Serratia marcescens]